MKPQKHYIIIIYYNYHRNSHESFTKKCCLIKSNSQQDINISFKVAELIPLTELAYSQMIVTINEFSQKIRFDNVGTALSPMALRSLSTTIKSLTVKGF